MLILVYVLASLLIHHRWGGHLPSLVARAQCSCHVFSCGRRYTDWFSMRPGLCSRGALSPPGPNRTRDEDKVDPVQGRGLRLAGSMRITGMCPGGSPRFCQETEIQAPCPTGPAGGFLSRSGMTACPCISHQTLASALRELSA